MHLRWDMIPTSMVQAPEVPPPSFAHHASGPLVWTGSGAGNCQKKSIETCWFFLTRTKAIV